MFRVLVLLEPVRSAEPPTVAGMAAVIASSAISHALRAAIDDRPAADQAWPRVRERFPDRSVHILGIEAVAFDRVPVRGLMPGDHILIARQIGRAVDGDLVVVP